MADVPLRVLLTLVDKLSQPFKKATSDVERSSGSLQNAAKDMGKGFSNVFTGIAQGIGMAAGQFLLQVPKMVGEFVNLGAQAEAAEHRFTQFAGSTEQANAYLAAFQTATDGTVPKMDAMTGASRLLQMGLVSNADEMSQVAAMATKLGDQTIGAGERLSGFGALLANQSIPRLDNYGISSGRVRERIKELQAATADMSREEAFKIAVMEEGRKALDTLGSTGELAGTKMAKLKAAVADAKVGLAEMAVSALDSVGSVDKLAETIRTLPGDLQKSSKAFADAEAAHWTGKDAIDAYNASMFASSEILTQQAQEAKAWADSWEWHRLEDAERDLTEVNERLAEQEQRMQEAREATEGLYTAVGGWEDAVDGSLESTEQQVASWETMKVSAEDLNSATAQLADEYAEKMQRIREATMNAALDMSMSWKSFYDQQSEDAAGWVEKEAEIHAGHEERLAEIRRQGQAMAIQIDAEAEETKLALLQEKLAIALQQQEEFTDKTKESSRMAKGLQIETLQGQIGEQEGMLAAYYEGRLIQQGANISADLAAEQARYAEELAIMQAAQVEQEAAQREALGRMVLQQFDSWASLNEIAGTQAVEMRMAIMQEYDLIDQESMNVVDAMLGTWDNWASGMGGSAKDAIASIDDVVAKQGKMVQSTETDVGDMVDADVSGFKERATAQKSTLDDMASEEKTYFTDKLREQSTSLATEASTDTSHFADKKSLQDTSLSDMTSTEETYYSDRATLQDNSLNAELDAASRFYSESISLQESSLNDSIRIFEMYFNNLLSVQSTSFSEMARAESERHSRQLQDEQAALDELLRMTDAAWMGIQDVVDSKTQDMQDAVDDSHREMERTVDDTTADMSDSWQVASGRVQEEIGAISNKAYELTEALNNIPTRIDIDVYINTHGSAPAGAIQTPPGDLGTQQGMMLGGLGMGMGAMQEMTPPRRDAPWYEYLEEQAITAQQNMMMRWTDFYERREETAAEYATALVEVETEHQARMAELIAEGNATAIATEQARYQEELALLQASRAEQEAAQRESLGRMVLQQFDSWASMNEISGSQAIEMRMAIMDEYDLIDEQSKMTVLGMVELWEMWAAGTAGSAEEAIGSIDDIMDTYDDMADSVGVGAGAMAGAEAAGYSERAATQTAALAVMATAEAAHYSDLADVTEATWSSVNDEVEAGTTFMQDSWAMTADNVQNQMGSIIDGTSQLITALYSIPTDILINVSINAPAVPSYQHGTTYHPGGMALVGERGPELAWLPAGSQVFPAYDPRSMTAARLSPPGAAGKPEPTIHIWGPVNIHGVQDPINLLEEIQALTV